MKRQMIYLSACAILIAGCANIQINAFGKTITRRQVENKYPHSFVCLADKAYVMPSKEWVDGCIKSYCRKYALSFVFKWSKRWDCDNRARHMSSYIREMFAQECPDTIEPDGVAVFVRFYHQDKDGNGHAVITMIIDNKVMDYDAVHFEWLNLSRKENALSWYVGD